MAASSAVTMGLFMISSVSCGWGVLGQLDRPWGGTGSVTDNRRSVTKDRPLRTSAHPPAYGSATCSGQSDRACLFTVEAILHLNQRGSGAGISRQQALGSSGEQSARVP